MKRFFSDVTLTAGSQAAAMGLGLAVQAVAARSLGLEEYGSYAAAHAFTALAEAVFLARGAELALHYIGRHWGRDMAAARGCWDLLIRQDWRVNWLVFAGMAIAGAGLCPLLGIRYWYVFFLGLAIPAQIGYSLSKTVFIINGRIQALAAFSTSYAIVSSCAMIICVALFGVPGLIAALVGSSLLKSAAAFLWARRWFPERGDRACCLEEAGGRPGMFLSANVHSVVRNAFLNAALHADVLLVNALRGPEAAALYKAAKTLASVPGKIAEPVWVAVRPRMLEALRRNDSRRLRLLLAGPAMLGLVLGAALAWPAIHWSGDLLGICFGEAYSAGGTILAWLLAAGWVLGAMTGWLSFAAAVSTAKSAGSLLYGMYFCAIAAGGAAFGSQSAEAMAAVMFASAVLLSIAAWMHFMRPAAWGGSSESRL